MARIFFAAQGSNTAIWEFTTENIELLAGMLAAGVGIMDDLNTNSTDTQYYVDSDADVSEFRVLSDVAEDAMRFYSIEQLQPGQYGIWLKSSKRFNYNLYAFRTNAFFQGIVSMCNWFEVDFRNYLYGFPFDHEGKQYALGGYVMAPNQIAIDVPDIDDIEEEEEADENINEPLPRSDEIITVRDDYIATPEETTYTD